MFNNICENIRFNLINIYSSIYLNNFNSPMIDTINSMVDLENYRLKYNVHEINETLRKYTKDYFTSNVLIIVTMQETSRSNTNKVTKIKRLDATNELHIYIQPKVSEIGTADMAMCHILIEISKDDFCNTKSIFLI